MTVIITGDENISLSGPGMRSTSPRELLSWFQLHFQSSGQPVTIPVAAPTVVDYGAKGDGVTDDSAAFQAAINAGTVRIPKSAAGYMIRRALNATNLDQLTIEGVGMIGPQWGLAYILPPAGSTILAGTGGLLLDITGSNNVTLRNFNISALGVSVSPSLVGIIGGTSTSTRLGGPGGANLIMENVSVCLQNSSASIPIYLNNVNLSRFNNVSTVGKYGVVLCSNNVLGLASQFTTFGASVQSDGNTFVGCCLLGYGDNPVLWLENANDNDFSQLYTVYIAEGRPSYSGCGYAIQIDNCTDLRIKVENDYYPYLLYLNGANDLLDVSGITYPGSNPPAGGQPAIAFFNGTTIKNSKFRVTTPGTTYPGGTFLYATKGSSPTMQQFRNCEFLFDSAACAGVAYLNVLSSSATPFFDLQFHGDTDSAGINLLVGGSAAPATKQRYFMNGLRQGAA
jgi:hypothetical protein